MNTRVRRPVSFVCAVLIVFLSLSAVGLGEEVIRISSFKALFGRYAEVSKITDAEITGV